MSWPGAFTRLFNLSPEPRVEASVKLIAIVVSAALFLEILDVSIVAIALPEIGRSLGVDSLSLGSLVTIYITGLAVVLPASSWVGLRFGSKQIFVLSLCCFSIASVLCGAAQELWHLLLGRFLQGAFAALMVPVGRTILLQRSQGSELVTAMIWFTIPALIAPVIAPPLGGIITGLAGWRWIFFLNIPFCVIGIAAALLILPSTPSSPKRRLDKTGWFFAGGGFSTALLTMELLLGGDPRPIAGSILAVVSISLTAGYLVHSRENKRAILDLKPFGSRVFSLTQLSSVIFRVGAGGIPILWPIFLQTGKGTSILEAGMLTAPLAIGALTARLFVKTGLHFLGFSRLMTLATLLSALMIAGVWALDPTTPLWMFAFYIFVLGTLRSVQLTALNTLCYVDLVKSDMPAASTLSSMVLHLGLGSSVAFGFFAVSIFTQASPSGEALFSSFQDGFTILSLAVALSVIPIWFLPKGSGAQVARQP